MIHRYCNYETLSNESANVTEEQKTEGEVILISKSGQTVRLPLA